MLGAVAVVEVVNTLDCESSLCGFEPHRSHKLNMKLSQVQSDVLAGEEQ